MHKYAFRFFFLILISGLIPVNLYAESSKLVTKEYRYEIDDLTNDWMVFDYTYKSFVPYTNRGGRPPRSVYIQSNFEGKERYFLSFYASKDLYIFINNRLFRHIKKAGVVDIKVKDILKKSGATDVLLNFYHKNHLVPFEHLKLYNIYTGDIKSLKKETYRIHPRAYVRQDTLIISLVLVSLVMAVTRYYRSSEISSFFSVSRLFKNVVQDDMKYFHTMFSRSLIYVILGSAMAAIALMLNDVHVFTYKLPNERITEYVNGQGWVFLSYLLLFLVISVAKYYYLFYLLLFLGESDFHRIHYHEYLRMTMVCFGGMILIPFIQNYSVLSGVSFFQLTLWIFLVVWLFRITYVAIFNSSFRNMFLISYICASEFIPLVITLKIITFYN